MVYQQRICRGAVHTDTQTAWPGPNEPAKGPANDRDLLENEPDIDREYCRKPRSPPLLLITGFSAGRRRTGHRYYLRSARSHFLGSTSVSNRSHSACPNQHSSTCRTIQGAPIGKSHHRSSTPVIDNHTEAVTHHFNDLGQA